MTKSMVFRSYTFIKAEKQKGTTFDQSDMGRCRIASSKMIQSRVGEVAMIDSDSGLKEATRVKRNDKGYKERKGL